MKKFLYTAKVVGMFSACYAVVMTPYIADLIEYILR